MLKNLGHKTGLFLDRFFAQVEEKDAYYVICSPQDPHYFWGNYLLFKEAPKRGEAEKMMEAYYQEFSKDQGFAAITFDTVDGSEAYLEDFKNLGFSIDESKILTCQKAIKPLKVRDDLEMRDYQLNDHYEQHVDVHFDPDWEYGSEEVQRAFILKRAQDFQRLIEAKLAHRYGIFKGEKLVADLGVYFADKVIRFNNVSTHRDHRRQGLCSSLVYKVSEGLIKDHPGTTLVMQADEDYHAAMIYESIGFKPTQRLICFEWFDKAKF
jgi:hypothetical protein